MSPWGRGRQSPVTPWTPPALLGEQILLTGAEVNGAPVPAPGEAHIAGAPGEVVPLALHWQMRQYVATDYTVLLHLLDAQGALVAQWDAPPVQGLLPTTLWTMDGAIVDAPAALTCPPTCRRATIAWSPACMTWLTCNACPSRSTARRRATPCPWRPPNDRRGRG